MNKNITRKYLSNKIHKNLGFSKNLSSKILDNFFEQIILQILISNKIKISSFGTFSVLEKKSPKIDKSIIESNIPILGICYGLQLLSKHFGGTIKKSLSREYGNATIKMNKHSKIIIL